MVCEEIYMCLVFDCISCLLIPFIYFVNYLFIFILAGFCFRFFSLSFPFSFVNFSFVFIFFVVRFCFFLFLSWIFMIFCFLFSYLFFYLSFFFTLSPYSSLSFLLFSLFSYPVPLFSLYASSSLSNPFFFSSPSSLGLLLSSFHRPSQPFIVLSSLPSFPSLHALSCSFPFLHSPLPSISFPSSSLIRSSPLSSDSPFSSSSFHTLSRSFLLPSPF